MRLKKTTKICPRCGQNKLRSEYWKSTRKYCDGLDAYCKDCRKELRKLSPQKKRKRTEEERHNNYKRERKNNPSKFIFNHAKSRAKKMGFEFNLTYEDVTIPELCPILGIPLAFPEPIKNGRAERWNSPSLDRVDNNKGYVKGNVIVCSYKANCMKSFGNAEEHRKIAEFIDSFNEEKK